MDDPKQVFIKRMITLRDDLVELFKAVKGIFDLLKSELERVNGVISDNLSRDAAKTLKELFRIVAKTALKIKHMLLHVTSISESRLQEVFPDNKDMSDVQKTLKLMATRITLIYECSVNACTIIGAGEGVTILEIDNRDLFTFVLRLCRHCNEDYTEMCQICLRHRDGIRMPRFRLTDYF